MQEKQLFIQLAVFVGGFTLEAAEAVCHGQGDVVHNVLEGLTSLVDKSLLRQEAGWDGEPRFRMLETIREYAWERLVSHAEVEEVRRQHAAYFLVLAECAERQLRGREQRSWLTRLELEHDNLRAVLRWAFEQEDTETALRLGSALATFWEVRGYWNEGGAWLTSALQMLDAQSVGVDAPNGQAGGATARVDQPLRAKALLAAARVIRDMEAVMPMLMEALQLFRELGETQGMADTLRLLGSMLGLKHGHERATALLTESLSLFRQIEDAVGCANALTQLGHIKLEQRALGQARALSEEALALWRALGHPIGMAWRLNTLGEVARLEKDYSTAGEYYSESLALGRELGHRGFIANSLHNLAYVEQFHGHYAQAAAYFMESLALAQELDNQATIASCLAGLASVMIVTGQHDAAVRRAIQLLGAVEAVRERLGVSLQVADLEEWSRSISSVRAGLDEGTFAAAWAEGRALSLEQALAYAI